MLADVHLAPFAGCGGGARSLDACIMWWSSGGTKSVLHNDGNDNLNCVILVVIDEMREPTKTKPRIRQTLLKPRSKLL